MGANQSREPTTGCPAPPTTVNLSKKPRDDARTTGRLHAPAKRKTISGQHVHKGAGLKGRAGHVRGRAVRVHLPAPHPKAHRGVRAGEELHLLSAHMGDTARASDEQHC